MSFDEVSSRDMAVIDTNCEYHGLSRLQLMENAGKGLADEITSRFSEKKVVIFAGTGNNGGDAFVAARHLRGFEIEIFLLGRERDISTRIAKINFEILRKCGYKIKEVRSELSIEVDGDIVVDGMLGTGVKGTLREPYKSVVEAINSSGAFVFAADVPTGLNPDTGEYDTCVSADVTVTFHRIKPGLLRAREVTGEIVVKDIGIPDALEKLTGPGDVQRTYKRFENAHKGAHGKILVVGGGPYTGAPALSALAALKCGADIVTVMVPKKVHKIVASFSPDLIVRKVDGKTIDMSDVSEIEKLAEKHDVLVMGMGSGSIEVAEVAEEVLKSGKVKKAVLDAEAITKNIPEDVECILTPHRGEFRRVFGIEEKSGWEESVRRAAEEYGATILLKSREDIISDGKRIRINKSGNPGMTVGGTGDVLAGITGAFFALNDAFWSASSAAFINGLSGDLCLEEKGFNFTAMDVVEKIPYAIKKALEFGK